MPHRGETEAQAETRRLAFETRRDQSVLDRLYEIERDTPFDTTELYHIPYYHTLEEQNQFLNSIAHTQFGSTLLRIQERSTRDRVPMILPKFSNTRLEAITTSTVHDYTFPHITKKEEEFLIAMNLSISEDINGKYVNYGSNKTQAFKDIVNGVFKYSIDSGSGRYEEITGFQRGQAYQAPAEPTVVSGVKPFEKPERVSVFQPAVTLSPKIKKIIDDWSVKKIIVPSWFANNNMNWVLEGRITEQEFLDAYTNLVNTGAITFTTPQVTIAPIPEITIPSIPEVSAEMQLITTNFQVKLDNKIQFSSSLSNADYKRLQDEMSLEPKITLVFLNQTDFNPLSNFSKILRQIQNLLQGQVVETVTISPTGQVITAPEPTVAPGKGLMGAGVLGIIGILMLGGFIADHVRKKR